MEGLTILEEDDFLVSQLNMDITNQYVIFSVDNEEYGIRILSVQEIISLPEVTRIPEVPQYIPGIINLRGNIIPLYILKTKFLNKEEKLNEDSIVIIVQTENEKNKTIGLIVDSVSDVVSIDSDKLEKSLNTLKPIDASFVESIGHIGERMIIILDMKNFFTDLNITKINNEEV